MALMPLPLTVAEQAQIGWTYILHHLRPITPFGKDRKSQIKLYTPEEITALQHELNNLQSMVSSCQQNPGFQDQLAFALAKIRDIRGILPKLQNDHPLDEVEFFALKRFAFTYHEIRDIYAKPELKLDSMDEISLPTLQPLITLLDPNGSLMPTFHVYSSYSNQLAQIREEKQQIEEKIFATSETDRDSLQAARNQVVLAENAENLKVRKRLTHELYSMAGTLAGIVDALGYLDFLRAKALIAIEFKAQSPVIVSDATFEVKNMRNPSMAAILGEQGRSFTPISLQLGTGVNLLTGANMGGKSVCLHTVLLTVCLAQSGFFVPADKVCLSPFSFIGMILNDEQDFTRGLSSFGAEIIRLREYFSANPKPSVLLVMDEFAKGTNPAEARILLQSVCQHLQSLGWISLLSTHYDGINLPSFNHFQVRGLRNVDMDKLEQKLSNISKLSKLDKSHKSPQTSESGNLGANEVQISASRVSISLLQDNMDYRIDKVTSTTDIPTDALNIAQILGLPTDIITNARELMKQRYHPGTNHDSPNHTE